VRAVKKVFGPHVAHLKMSATKSMTGHCLGAAGAIEAIATIKSIETGILPPTINLEEPEEELEGIDVVPHIAKPHKITAALSNSFGFGGHNSTLVFGPWDGA
jgi:3-oxoacyl-[acyl-carrier-protein] synthase II